MNVIAETIASGRHSWCKSRCWELTCWDNNYEAKRIEILKIIWTFETSKPMIVAHFLQLSNTSRSFLNNATNWEPSIQIYETIGAVLMQATSGSLPISEKVLWVSTLSGMLNVLELQDMHWSFTLCYASCTMIFAGHAFEFQSVSKWIQKANSWRYLTNELVQFYSMFLFPANHSERADCAAIFYTVCLLGILTSCPKWKSLSVNLQ